MKGLRRDRERSKRKGLRDEGIKGLRKKERISVVDRGRGQARGGTLEGAGGRFFMKVGGSRPAGAGLWRVLKMKDFWFMGNMVTDRVGHWWG